MDLGIPLDEPTLHELIRRANLIDECISSVVTMVHSKLHPKFPASTTLVFDELLTLMEVLSKALKLKTQNIRLIEDAKSELARLKDSTK